MTIQIKNTLFYLYRYSFKTVTLFWFYYFLIIFISLLSSINSNVSFEFTGVTSLPSMVFMIFFSITTFKNVFPQVIKLGVTRKAFAFALYIYAFILSALMTALSNLMVWLFNILKDIFSIEGFNYISFSMSEFNEPLFGNPYVFDWLMHLFLFLLFTFTAIIFYRFGMTYGILFSAILPVCLFIPAIGKRIVELGSYLAIFDVNYTPLSFVVVFVALGLLIWLALYRASIIDQISKQT